MKRHLLLMRHAKSDWDVPVHDFERPLAKRGRKACERVGKWLALQGGFVPDYILCSPAERSRRTVLAIAPYVDFPFEDIVWCNRLYEASSQELLEQIRTLPEESHCTLLVAHNPGLEDLLLQLCDAPPHTGKVFPTAAVATIIVDSWRTLGNGKVHLENMVLPRQLPD